MSGGGGGGGHVTFMDELNEVQVYENRRDNRGRPPTSPRSSSSANRHITIPQGFRTDSRESPVPELSMPASSSSVSDWSEGHCQLRERIADDDGAIGEQSRRRSGYPHIESVTAARRDGPSFPSLPTTQRLVLADSCDVRSNQTRTVSPLPLAHRGTLPIVQSAVRINSFRGYVTTRR